MKSNSIEIRTWSMLGQRGTFGKALTELAEENTDIVALSADLCNTSGLDRFADRYPDRFWNVGIAEQNLIAVGAALADEGMIPFATTFANFCCLRGGEFVRHFMGYMQSNLKLVGLGAGYSMEYFGNTHYALEDIAAIRSISNITIISPADGFELAKAVKAAADYKGGVYLRLTGVMNHPIVYREDFDFKIGKANILKEEGEVVLIACGSMVNYAMETAKRLEQEQITCAVIDMHTIKPLDIDTLNHFKERKLFVSMEEHSIVGGLGSAVAEYLATGKKTPKLLRLGVLQGYTKAGDYTYMLKQSGLMPEDMFQNIMEEWKGI